MCQSQRCLYICLYIAVSLIDLRPFCFWWSDSRIDYQLELLGGLENSEYLPNTAYAHIVQARYWEAKEMLSFILRQVTNH